MSLPQRFDAERLHRDRPGPGEEARARRRRFLLAVSGFVLWPLLGLAVMAWGFHTTHAEFGRAAVEGGALLGSAGVVGTMLWYLAKRE